MRSTFLSASVLSFALASSAFVHSAHAQGDVAAAQALYDKAVEQMAAKSFAEACPKLEEVTRLMPEGLGAKLTLAECYEGQGKLASAWLQYALVEAAAGRADQGERQRLAGERAAAPVASASGAVAKKPDPVAVAKPTGPTKPSSGGSTAATPPATGTPAAKPTATPVSKPVGHGIL
jgi:thioredoxin-like negative regulator of GroEL